MRKDEFVRLDREGLPDLVAFGGPDPAARSVAAAAQLLLGPASDGQLARLTGGLAWWLWGRRELRRLQGEGLPLQELPDRRWRLIPPWRGPQTGVLASYLEEGSLEPTDLWRFAERWPRQYSALAYEAIQIREACRSREPTAAERDRLQRICAAFGLQ